MKSFKRILAAALVLLGAVLLAIISIYLLVDDATLVSHLVKRLESSSDIRVLHRGDAHITRTLTPTLTVDDLVMADTGRQYRVETGSLEVQISLPRLLLGQLDIPHLWIGDTQIEIKEDASPGRPAAAPELKPGPKLSPLPFKPVLHDIRIAKLEIIHEGGTLLLKDSHIRELTLNISPDNAIELSGRAELAKQNIDVKAVLKDVDEYFGGQPLAFSVGVESKLLHLSLKGHIDFEKPDPTIEAAARGWTPGAKKIVTGIKHVEIPGKLTFESQLKGTFAQLAVEQIKATWKGSNQSGAELKGSIANAIKLEGVQLNLTGKLDNPDWLTPLLPESLGAVKRASVAAQISGAYPMLAVNDFDFHGKTEHDLDLSLSGKFDLALSSTGLEPANMRTELVFAAPRTRAARFLIFDEIPEFGAITGRCDVRSQVGDPSLENITVQIKDRSGIQANLSGRIDKFPLADRPNSGYDLDVSMQATEGTVMVERVGIKLSALGPLDLDFRIEGSTQALQLNKIKLATGKKDGVLIGAQGQLWFGDWDQADPFETIDLKLQAQSHTTHALSTWIGQELPELGPLSGEARLHTVSGKHRLDQLHIQTIEGAPLTVAVSGSAEHVTLLPELRIREIKLDANAGTDNTAQLNTVFGLQGEIPPVGPLKAQARISGDDQNLVIGEVSMAAGQENLLLVNLSGRLGKLSAANHWQPQNTSLSIRASSTSSRALAETLGYRLPELGPLAAQANIHSNNKKLSIDSAQLRLGEIDNPVVKATGYVNDLSAMKGVKVDAKLHLDGHRFAAFADFHKLPDLAAVTGQLSISDSDGTLGIDSLQVETGQPKLLSLKLDASFDDFKDPYTLLLNGSLAAQDLQLIGAIFDRQWAAIGPVQLDAEIKRTGKGNELNSTLTAGETEVQANLNALFKTTPMRVSGTITARELLVWDLLEKASDGEKKKASSKEPVFSREPIDFDWLKKVDMDIAIEVESFAQEQFLADSAQFQVVVKSGILSISPARFVYPKGKLDIDLQLDGRDHPRLTFKAFGEHLDPRRALDIQEYKGKFEAEMNIDVSFSTSGLSPHELASNSQGSIYITMQNGKIPAALIDLVFVDIAGWAWHKTTKRRYYEFDCGVADYSIEQGIISTKAFILNAKHIAITGGGTIDLGGEEVDYVLLPKKKSRLIKKAEPVKIKGPLNDPKVKALPWKSAAITAAKVGGIIFAPLIFIPLTVADYAAGRVKSNDEESSCLEYQKTHKMEKKPQN
ncbi:MAG: AsmA family protein [Syntrophobacteria bacterium]